MRVFANVSLLHFSGRNTGPRVASETEPPQIPLNQSGSLEYRFIRGIITASGGGVAGTGLWHMAQNPTRAGVAQGALMLFGGAVVAAYGLSKKVQNAVLRVTWPLEQKLDVWRDRLADRAVQRKLEREFGPLWKNRKDRKKA